MKNKIVRIAVDGPGGAGKSSVSREIAKALGIIYVDTGALYRTIGLYMLSSGIDPKDKDAVCAALGNFTLSLSFENGKQVILLDGTDVGDSIRTPEVSMAASAVSAIPEVREYLLKMQRDTAKTNSVIMDGRAVNSCCVFAIEADGSTVETIEGIGTADEPHPLQQAFIDAGAIQCGYCTPGMIMAAKALLDRDPHHTREEIHAAMSGNLCRCTGYTKIEEAIVAASRVIEQYANGKGAQQ